VCWVHCNGFHAATPLYCVGRQSDGSFAQQAQCSYAHSVGTQSEDNAANRRRPPYERNIWQVVHGYHAEHLSIIRCSHWHRRSLRPNVVQMATAYRSHPHRRHARRRNEGTVAIYRHGRETFIFRRCCNLTMAIRRHGMMRPRRTPATR
jgi:hypothetical protein